MGIEKFCMFFERSNSRGTELSFIDIITAKIYKDFKLDKNVNEFKEKYKDILFDPATVETFVRYISFLKEKKVDRKTILTRLDGNDFVENWHAISGLYVKSYYFLASQKLIFKNDWVPYKTMYIPIIHFLNNLPHKDFSQINTYQMKLFRFWFWGSLLNTRYGGGMLGSTNDIIVEDSKMLENIAKGGGFTKHYLKQFKFEYGNNDFFELTSKGAIFTGIMSIMNFKAGGFKNLGNHNQLDFNNQINIHHIFPTKYIEKSFGKESFEDENSDSILNKMIIERIPNIKFGEKKPSTYLGELNDNKTLLESLKSHYIPAPEKLINGDLDNNFRDFLNERAKSFLTLVQSEINDLKTELLEEIENNEKKQNDGISTP